MKIDVLVDDAYLNLLKEAASFLDGQLIRLEAEARISEDPDTSGQYDRLEYVTGLGFVACQQYMIGAFARKKINKQTALDLGPKHRCGETFASLVNAAANYWKHREEWGGSNGGNRRADQTARLLRSLGLNLEQSYVIANALYELLRPHAARFERLIPFLTRWRNDVLEENAAKQ